MATLPLMITFLFFCPALLQADKIKDSESATHSSAAASYQVVDTYKFPGFKLIQLDLAVLSQFSYMVISEGKALVIDPNRDVDAYVQKAKQEEVSIIGVFLTHNNADFVAGHMELAKLTGCPIYISRKAGAGFAYKSLKEGSIIEVGRTILKCIDTPGHTRDHLCWHWPSHSVAAANWH